MITGPKAQKIIQGKTYCLRLQFSDEDVAKIDKLWFTCSTLGIAQEMTLTNNNIYVFTLTWQQTQALKPLTTTYNITVQLIGEDNPRDLANGLMLKVVKNENPVPDTNEEEE